MDQEILFVVSYLVMGKIVRWLWIHIADWYVAQKWGSEAGLGVWAEAHELVPGRARWYHGEPYASILWPAFIYHLADLLIDGEQNYIRKHRT